MTAPHSYSLIQTVDFLARSVIKLIKAIVTVRMTEDDRRFINVQALFELVSNESAALYFMIGIMTNPPIKRSIPAPV